jgi:hypothetical protein
VCLCLVAFQAALKPSDEKKQHVCIKFCVTLGENSADTFEMLKATFGDECLSDARTLTWFKGGQTSVDDNPRFE